MLPAEHLFPFPYAPTFRQWIGGATKHQRAVEVSSWEVRESCNKEALVLPFRIHNIFTGTKRLLNNVTPQVRNRLQHFYSQISFLPFDSSDAGTCFHKGEWAKNRLQHCWQKKKTSVQLWINWQSLQLKNLQFSMHLADAAAVDRLWSLQWT